MLAWLRRIIVSVGIGGFSYALMLGFMVLSVIYDKELEPVINFAFDTGRLITNWLDSLVAGTYCGQVAVVMALPPHADVIRNGVPILDLPSRIAIIFA